MATLNRHRSKQDYATPEEFMKALKVKLHIDHFCVDLAASEANTKAHIYFDEVMDSLKLPWDTDICCGGWAYLNPPYGNLGEWVKKASQSKCRIAALVPASVGANWWKNYVHNRCLVLFLNGRITFVGAEDPYPKDLAVLLYNIPAVGYNVWTWKER